jgi:hypothetical protein
MSGLLHTRVGAALSAVALLMAIFLRPQPLPGGAAHYSSTAPAPGQAVSGHTYHIDTIAVGNHAPVLAAEPHSVAAGEPVVVGGWAINPLTLRPAVRLVAVDRGRPEPVQLYGAARPDVATALGNAAAPKCGFLFLPLASANRPAARFMLSRGPFRDKHGKLEAARAVSLSRRASQKMSPPRNR